MARKHSGILSNAYVPPLPPSAIVKELSRLSTESLFNLVDLWLTLPVTQPVPTKAQRANGVTRAVLTQRGNETLAQLRGPKARSKRKLIDRLLVDFYPSGLNALQLAQVDVQLMVDKPNMYSWISSTVKVMDSPDVPDESQKDAMQDFIFSLDSQAFLDKLIQNLANLYLTHIYISRHPRLPLIIIRIQIYEYVHLKKSRKTHHNSNLANAAMPDIISRKPFYLAIPTNSPNLIHSTANSNDLASNLILQAVEMTLSTPLRQVTLLQNADPPLKNLEAMHILKGVSRFGNSLGSWTPYADGTVDIGPLSHPSEHIVLNPEMVGRPDDKDVEKSTASLRFNGSLRDRPITKRLYDDNRPQKKQKLSSTEEYASVVPIQSTEYILENRITKGPAEPPSIRLRLFGRDIFAGLHELASTDGGGAVDSTRLPNWLSGEQGLHSGIIKDGQFTKIDQ